LLLAQPTRAALAVLERAARALGIAGEAAASAPGDSRDAAAQQQQPQGGGSDDRGDTAPRRRRAEQPAAQAGPRRRAPPAPAAVDAAAVEVLTSMGFDADAALSALHQAAGDVTLAAELLLAAA
jgi:hypothetical protein